jgi:putative oxidoreductase
MTRDRLSDPAGLGPHRVKSWMVGALTGAGLVVALYAAWAAPATTLPAGAAAFMLIFLGISTVAALVLAGISFVAGWLVGLLTLLMGWRIAGLLGVDLVAWALLPAFAAYLAQFVEALRGDRARGMAAILSDAEWTLAAIRIYVGFDLVPHFTEKLFAGPLPRGDDVASFAAFGLPFPTAFVVVAGLCELGAAIGIGLGLFTRLAGVCAALYFLIATLIGGHFGLGFIWASPGGGWEYPVLMMALFLAFAAYGGGRFSVDAALDASGDFPPALRRAAFRDPA